MSLPIVIPLALFLLSWIGYSLFRFFVGLCRHREIGERIYGPTADPILGNVPMFPKCRYEWIQFLVNQSDIALEKGQKMIRWWVGPSKLSVWLLDAETSRILLEHPSELKKGRDYVFYEQWLGKEGLLLSDGQLWRQQRKALTPTFHFKMLNHYTDIFNRQAKILVGKMTQLEGKTQQEDISPLLARCSLDIIGESAMGIKMESQRDGNQDYVNAVHQFNFVAHVYSTNIFYWIKPIWWLSGWQKVTKACVQTLENFSKNVIEERKRTKNNKKNPEKCEGDEASTRRGGKAFLDLLLELEADGQMSREQVRKQTDTFLFAGHDTTANALGWTLWCLACHPECQQKVQRELREVIGGEEDGLQEIDANLANQLRYLDLCVRESLRLFPPVPVLERDLLEDLHIGDVMIPAGTLVIVSPFILHHREKVFPNHWQFDPDNFLLDRQSNRSTFDFVPFSAGPRNCIGQKFATLELKIVLAHILRRFTLTTDLPFLSNRPGLEAILRPEFGIPVRIHSATSKAAK